MRRRRRATRQHRRAPVLRGTVVSTPRLACSPCYGSSPIRVDALVAMHRDPLVASAPQPTGRAWRLAMPERKDEPANLYGVLEPTTQGGIRRLLPGSAPVGVVWVCARLGCARCALSAARRKAPAPVRAPGLNRLSGARGRAARPRRLCSVRRWRCRCCLTRAPQLLFSWSQGAWMPAAYRDCAAALAAGLSHSNS